MMTMDVCQGERQALAARMAARASSRSRWRSAVATAVAIVGCGCLAPASISLGTSPFPVSGQLAYHCYSSYLAEPLDADDGHIFLLALPEGVRTNLTAGLPVENAMNPRFSPDGTKIAFMAIPRGVAPPRSERTYGARGRFLEIFVLDLPTGALARLTHNAIPDEDPSYSPDGLRIIFKRAAQIWEMAADGARPRRLTFSAQEKSGPRYSPDGSHVTYWEQAGPLADIWRSPLSGARASLVIGAAGVSEYYPLYRDAQTLLYVRWASVSDRHDKIYRHSLSTNTSEALCCNAPGADDSDPFVVDSEHIGFSSTRAAGNYDIFLANERTGVVQVVAEAAGPYHEFGGCYSSGPR